jgi:hypothetical protein
MFLVAVFVNFYYNNNKPLTMTEVEIDSIKKSCYYIKSIQPEDSNFQDLMFFKTILQDKRVVCLGEQLHSDGSAFLAKSRLVRFLHEEMDFDVLLFESSLFDMWMMNEEWHRKDFLQPEIGLWGFWAKAQETAFLTNYIQSQSEKNDTLFFGGFDIQGRSGNSIDDVYKEFIIKYLTENKIAITDYPQFDYLVNHFADVLFFKNKNVQKSSLFTEMDSMICALESSLDLSFEDEIYLRFFKGLKNWLFCMWNYQFGDVRRLNIRDSLMSDNLLWWINRVYPEKKIIVWTANSHLLFQNNLTTQPKYITMGNQIKKQLLSDSYFICISSFGRLNASGNLISQGSNRAIENIFHEFNTPCFFIDFNAINSSSPLQQKIFMRVNQDICLQDEWYNMMDGLLYIDTIKNITFTK